VQAPGPRDTWESRALTHIRKLADLKRNSDKGPASWKRRMALLKRKTLVVCHYCHIAIHAGRPTRMRPMQEANPGY
jgi:hypothetical protein